MSDKLSQRERVERELKLNGFVSRNYYLDLPFDKILRLGVIIERLRKDGWNITTEITERDTLYHAKPKVIEHYNVVLPDGTKEPYTKQIWK
jgi:hypothetical protein